MYKDFWIFKPPTEISPGWGQRLLSREMKLAGSETTEETQRNFRGKRRLTQSYHNIKEKQKKLKRGPLTPQVQFSVLAFKVYHGWGEKACKQKYHMLAKAVLSAPRIALDFCSSKAKRPPRSCHKCGHQIHCPRTCPNFCKSKEP